MAMFFIPLSFLSRSFIFSGVFHFQSGVAFIQEIISPLFQAHCRRPVTQLYNLIRNSRGKKEAKASTFSKLIFVSLFVLCCCCCECVCAHLCVAEWGAKRRLGCVDINGFTMECVKAWELVAAKLH